jgi:hypothetical protein
MSLRKINHCIRDGLVTLSEKSAEFLSPQQEKTPYSTLCNSGSRCHRRVVDTWSQVNYISTSGVHQSDVETETEKSDTGKHDLRVGGDHISEHRPPQSPIPYYTYEQNQNQDMLVYTTPFRAPPLPPLPHLFFTTSPATTLELVETYMSQIWMELSLRAMNEICA